MPFDLPVQISGFTRPALGVTNGNVVESFLTGDLIRAAIVAGYRQRAGAIDWRIRAWRLAAMRLAIRSGLRAGNRGLAHPKIWKSLDPSEKAAVSNMLGNTVTKLLCERVLDTPFIAFVDLYSPRLNILRRRGQRPDFVGRMRSGRWFSVEAKGRTNAPSTKSLRSAKSQARAILSVHGRRPVAYVVCWTMFRRGTVAARFHDPPSPKRGFDLNIEPNQFLRNYYEPVLALWEASKPVEAVDNMEMRNFEAADFRLGMHPLVSDALRSGEFTWLEKLQSAHVEKKAITGEATLGPDGIAVIPGSSWDGVAQTR